MISGFRPGSRASFGFAQDRLLFGASRRAHPFLSTSLPFSKQSGVRQKRVEGFHKFSVIKMVFLLPNPRPR